MEGVRNQNEVATQNQGEESQLQVATREKEQSEMEEPSLQTKSQMAIQHMNDVSEKIRMMLQIRTSGEIGETIKTLAQMQNQAQLQIEESVRKLNTRGGITRFLFGPNYSVLNDLKAQIGQNQTRIKELTELKNNLSNQGDLQKVEETIAAMIAQNTSLQEMIEAQWRTKSVFGWLIKLFVR